MIRMASNEVQEFREKRDAYESAKRAGVKGNDLGKLKAAADAAKSKTPGGKGGGGGIFD